MLVVALTGGIGAGKSLVAQYFSELGARVVDADQLSRIAIERGSAGFDEVITRFGESVLSNGDIDRKDGGVELGFAGGSNNYGNRLPLALAAVANRYFAAIKTWGICIHNLKYMPMQFWVR